MNEKSYVWAMFYAGLVSIQAHPRGDMFAEGKSLKHPLDFYAEVADLMLSRYLVRFKENEKCRG